MFRRFPDFIENLGPHPIIVYKRENNIKEILERKTINKNFEVKGMMTCQNCSYCRYIQEGNSLVINGKKYQIEGDFFPATQKKWCMQHYVPVVLVFILAKL